MQEHFPPKLLLSADALYVVLHIPQVLFQFLFSCVSDPHITMPILHPNRRKALTLFPAKWQHRLNPQINVPEQKPPQKAKTHQKDLTIPTSPVEHCHGCGPTLPNHFPGKSELRFLSLARFSLYLFPQFISWRILILFREARIDKGIKKFHLIVIMVDYFLFVMIADIRQIPYNKKQLIADY